jgi:hypothetical protein
MATKTTTKPEKLKQWIFGELLDNGEIDFIYENLSTEALFLEDTYEAGGNYFRIDPIHIEKIKIETKIVKA